jgi:2-phosphosulfolactate phosphatase
VNSAEAQQKYQVRFDWGQAGFAALVDSVDVVILADALPSVPAGTDAGGVTSLAGHRVITANLSNRAAVAAWVLERQTEKADRFSVAVIAVGERRDSGELRFAVEDFLVAGGVIDALSDLGIDHCSPEAAAASAGFLGLARAVKHLVSASETAQALSALGAAALPTAAGAPGEAEEIELLGEFAFPA